ncbi:hypothetical protein LV84_04174 [Algoriphagus ratkowskyi]|uniref:Dolichyl-phosphate-mannose-protein mannosyltransferase n=1 Tax=Algoriphagus ratkowskyi TaxID=57028 RepID=A0A2W7SGC9_9BACT|nr:hypothetical protein [Algoriphagus ratkowskyi]PZX49782.1 hypothetical protein LV84_04174 [Algoriphagus ratkowskyi]TXD75498.1 hypothetical protein ESW18_20435 [Algoriphagus ratkowskyi]
MEKVSATQFVRIWATLGLLALILIWFLPWRFQTNDDEIMMWLVSGAYTGTPESFAVFIHPILSWVFAKLYTLFPEIPWYPLTWFGAMYMSYIISLELIWKRKSDQIQRHCWSLFLFAFLIHFTFFLQFSIVAAFLASAGLLARILKTQGLKFQVKLYWTDLLIVLGFLIRYEVPFLILAGLLSLNFILRQKRVFTAALIPILFLCISVGFTQLWIHQQGLGEFQKLNTLRSQVFDHPVLQLMKDGFKNEDPNLYFFANGLIDFQRDELSVEKMETWKVSLDQARFPLYQPTWIIQSFRTFLEHERFFIALISFFLIFGTFIFRTKVIYLALTLFFIALVLSPFYLLKVQIYAILFLTLISACFLLPEKSFLSNTKIIYPISIILILLLGVHFTSFFKSKANLVSSRSLDENLLNLRNDGYERIYLIGAGSILREYRFAKNIPFKLLGWPTFLEGSQFTDSNKTAYLIDNNTYSTFSAYFKKHEEQQILMDDYILLDLK